MKIDMHINLCVHAIWLPMHPCLKGNVPGAWASAFSLLVLQVLTIYLQGLHVPCHTCTSALLVHKITVQPLLVAVCSWIFQ